MAHNGTLDRDEVRGRLFSSLPDAIFRGQEENQHIWRARSHRSYERPLLRIWDQYSGSQPEQGHGMKSRAPDMRLDTFEVRRSSLADHLDHKNWGCPSPFISFTTSSTAIEDLVRMRVDRRGPQTLTVIDPMKRIKNGLPVLDVAAEMQNYDISDPYRRGNQYYIDHHVCLWEVTKAEIVGHWPWDDLKHDPNWYMNIVMPAFRESRETATQPRCTQPYITDVTAGAMDDLLSSFKSLSGRLATLNWISRKLILEVGHIDQDLSRTDRDKKYEIPYYDEDYDWDTDDEVEEANTNDDILKMIEGLW